MQVLRLRAVRGGSMGAAGWQNPGDEFDVVGLEVAGALVATHKAAPVGAASAEAIAGHLRAVGSVRGAKRAAWRVLTKQG
jgi:hypothetical protein